MFHVRSSVIAALFLSCVSTTGYAQMTYMTGIGAHNSCGKYLSAVYNQPPGQTGSIKLREGQFFN